jgi:DNA polymerase-3 subunit delta'
VTTASAAPAIVGHERVKQQLARAIHSGRLPGSLLLHGPAGVGKQRLGIWLAQRILCERAQADPPGDSLFGAPPPSAVPAFDVEPCGRCTSCRLMGHIEHPDFHWFFPVENIPGRGEKRADAFEVARAEALVARRAFDWPTSRGMVGLYLDQMLTLRAHAAKKPAMGRRKVFLLGDAERLVTQEASPEAANALLKLLEEPPDDTTLVLTAADPDGLLPTIRSRLLPVRVDPLPIEQVAAWLREQAAVGDERAAAIATAARGAIGIALDLAADDDGGPYAQELAAGRELLAAVAHRSPIPAAAIAHAQSPARAREFAGTLHALNLWLRDLTAVASGAEQHAVNADAIPWLRSIASELPRSATAGPEAITAVERAASLAAGNVNPQLILADLLPSLRAVLGAPTARA